jgi:hypothetical protein
MVLSAWVIHATGIRRRAWISKVFSRANFHALDHVTANRVTWRGLSEAGEDVTGISLPLNSPFHIIV